MKRIIATLLSLAMLIPLISVDVQAVDTTSTTLPAEEVNPIEYYDESMEIPAAIPDDVLWITNEDGVAETQEIFYLPEDGSLPDYITDIEYLDNSDARYVDEDLPDDEFILEPSEDEYSLIEIPLYLPLNSGNIISTDEIRLLETVEFATTHIQIYDPESDIAILDTDFPITETCQIILSEGQEYWVSLVTDYGSYFDSYYGTLAAFAGTLEITGGWHFTTDKVDLVAAESDIEPYGTTMNEKEPNDSQYTATTYENDADMYGTISSTSDVDYFKVTFGRDGNANFYLGNIPSDCNYDMKIYSQPISGGGLTLLRTLATSGNYEQLLNLPVTSDKIYYMQVYSSKGSSTTAKYQVRAKITPTDDKFEPNNSFGTATALSTYSYIDATLHKTGDIDYYVVNCSSGVLTVTLSNIPWGCDYRFVVYDSSKNQIAETTTSGNAEKETSVAVGYGKCYIKVYSKSGSNQTSKYRLKASTRSGTTSVSGYIRPKIKSQGDGSLEYTPIGNLPIHIVCTLRGNVGLQRTLATTTTNSNGYFSTSFTLPSEAAKIFVQTYPSNSNISVQTLLEAVPVLMYEVPLAEASISFDSKNIANLSAQSLVSMSLWRLGNKGLSIYKSKGSYPCKQLVLRCTAGQSCATAASGVRININGVPEDQDYYDYDVLMHEMGHWVMINIGGRPDGKVVNHTWGTKSSPLTAYAEGWAHYFSCAMRDKGTIRDYRASSGNPYIGGDLDTGYVVSSYGNSPWRPTQSTYKDNMSYEIFVACALWNLSADIGTNYWTMESIMESPRNDWKDFYNAYMKEISTAKRKTAWETCEEFKVAFDMETPVVSMTISNLIANMSATDNVSVESFDWYVDGQKRASGTGSTGSLNLKNLNLAAGAHTLECRVYDPEGKATGNRPRTDRAGTASKTFVIPDTVAVSTDSVGWEPLVSENELETHMNFVSLPIGTDYTYTVNSLGNMDINLSMSINGAVKAINIYTPNGDLYESMTYLSPDAPYTIENADAGEWQITVINYTIDELRGIAYDQGDEASYSAKYSLPDTKIWIGAKTMPTSVNVDVPSITNNPNILSEIFSEIGVLVMENGQLVDTNTPLADGIHVFSASREIAGIYSEAREYAIEVDTVAPEITFVDLPNAVDRDRFLLQIHFSENVASATINDEEIDLGSCGGNTSYTNAIRLESGVNWFSLVVTDYAGNSSYETFSVERLS